MSDFVVLKKIETLEEAMILRNIRNQCKDFMTRDCSYISEDQQKRWFENLDPNVKIYLLYLVEFGVVSSPVGYGLIREEAGFSLVSGGLVESCRGKGYGKILFDYLIKNLDKEMPIKLEVLKNNTRAFFIYNKLGFRVVKDDGKVITMEYHYDSVI
jgi:ribosomal protein S18 acetylase RimI-like enzyme